MYAKNSDWFAFGSVSSDSNAQISALVGRSTEANAANVMLHFKLDAISIEV